MTDLKLGLVETRFADIVWQHAPLTIKELLALCEQELNWKRTTTYTVIKRLSERGILKNENTVVTALVSKEEVQASEIDNLVKNKFEDSLPAFVAAFAKHRNLSHADNDAVRAMIDQYRKEHSDE